MGLRDLFSRGKKDDDVREPDPRTDDEKIKDAQDAATSGAASVTAGASVSIGSS